MATSPSDATCPADAATLDEDLPVIAAVLAVVVRTSSPASDVPAGAAGTSLWHLQGRLANLRD